MSNYPIILSVLFAFLLLACDRSQQDQQAPVDVNKPTTAGVSITNANATPIDATPIDISPTDASRSASENTLNQDAQPKRVNSAVKPVKKADDTYKVIEWIDLLPAKELNILLNPPEYLDDVEDGSEEDQILSKIQAQIDIDKSDPYQQALISRNVVSDMNGQRIRLPGFVVPLAFGDDEFEVTQFFLVPFFGACIHLPPPPPNQIVYVNYPQGIELKDLYDAFWLSGTMKTTLTENETATSAYTLVLDSIDPYYD